MNQIPNSGAVSSSHGGFLPAIEGMRALAVIVVLLFHLDIEIFAGGFLGVDLFFVISGFIITRNILFDLDAGKFSLPDFYVRRFRRLFPALLMTIIVTLAVAYWVVPPTELAKTAKSAIYAVFSLANFNFWWDSGYFSAASDTKPLLHTWSLSVEEQFYLIWPTLLLLATGLRGRAIIAFALLVLSVLGAYLMISDHTDAVFYLLPFRVHQLMAGALVAILVIRSSGPIGGACSLLAATLFAILTVSPAGTDPFVGALAVSGLGVLILVGRESGPAERVFGNGMMRWIGQRSYALYLVHWPAIVLYKYHFGFTLELVDQVVLAVVSLLCAGLLHKWVEQPFRKPWEYAKSFQRVNVSVLGACLFATLFTASNFWGYDGYPDRLDPDVQKLVSSADEEIEIRRKAIRWGICNMHRIFRFSDYQKDVCISPQPDFLNAIVIGDSMASDTYMMLSMTYGESVNISQATAGECTALTRQVEWTYSTCEKLNKYRFSEEALKDMDLVILASDWNSEKLPLLIETLKHLDNLGKEVIIFGPRMYFSVSVPLLVSQQYTLDQASQLLRGEAVTRRETLEMLETALPKARIIDIASIQCEPQCDAILDERLMYYDKVHFTELGARIIGQRLRESGVLPELEP